MSLEEQINNYQEKRYQYVQYYKPETPIQLSSGGNGK